MWLFLAFLLVPLVEIGLFIQIGGWIGLWPTLGIVVLTAVAGTALVRSQGMQTLQRLRRSLDELRDPTEPLADGAMILISGALLLTPGFFTDAVGFALLVPGVRRAIMSALRRRVATASVVTNRRDWRREGDWRPEDDVIEGSFEIDETQDRRGPSGWTRH